MIFVALSSFATYDAGIIDTLAKTGFSYRLHTSGKRITREELLINAGDAVVIIAGVEKYDADLLAQLKSLRCIVRLGTGVDAIDLAAAKQLGITVLNTPDIPAIAVAELALTCFLALSRNIIKQSRLAAEKKWERLDAHLLTGKTLGLIGFGRIGQKVAALCKPFGMRILVHDPFTDLQQHAGIEPVNKEILLRESDIVSIHAAAQKGECLIGEKEINVMKKGALLVNLARGGMVDETALLAALQSGQLAGAGLDVYTEEPYAGPLTELDNVVLTPHSATLTVETRNAMERACIDKAVRFLKGSITTDEKVV
jgi:D-3-phosphoglycerate dehydrogenase